MTVKMTCMDCGEELSDRQLAEVVSVSKAAIRFGTTARFVHQCEEKK